MAKLKKENQEELTQDVDVASQSEYKFKDEFFNRKKSSIKNKKVSVKDADWRKFCIAGEPITAFKGQVLTHNEVKKIKADPKAFGFFLEEVK